MNGTDLKAIWREERCAANGWLGIPSGVAAENMAQAGWDSVTLDLQHGLVDYPAAVQMLQAIRSSGSVPLARVPWNEPGITGKLLDAGCLGIIAPMINSREEAERLVTSCRYPPEGMRSFGPTRANWVHGSDYGATANARVAVIAMIETREAVDHVDEILQTPGLDGCYIGPSDLGLSYGFGAKPDRDEPEMIEIIERILQAARRAGIAAGIHCGSPEAARAMADRGFNLVTIMSDNALLNQAARSALGRFREGQAAPARPAQGAIY